MALFGKKSPCAICGGKVSALFPWKIAGEYVCNLCHGQVDMPEEVEKSMTLEQFREYIAFRDANNALKADFVATKNFDFGILDTKIVMDIPKGRICFDKQLNATVFERGQIKYFVIKEDMVPIFEGDANGLRCFPSSVPERAARMGGDIIQFRMRREAFRRQQQNNPNVTEPYFDIPEPFNNFNLEIMFDHPYRREFKADMSGPVLSNDRPDIDRYLREYTEKYNMMHDLARSLMELAFPGAGEQSVSGTGGVVINNYGSGPAASAAVGDPVAEIQKYKTLLDQGIITEEEFTAKKRQLLGI